MDGTDPGAFLVSLFEFADWVRDAHVADVAKGPLLRLCARYLTSLTAGRDGRERAVDAVAHFHLSNGARIERLNWLADSSPKGLSQSAGIMVNYLYRLADIEKNHEEYKTAARVQTASGIKARL
jgi:malonyl-CoA decarboxylase